MIAILIGTIFMGAGLWGLVNWFPEFLILFKGIGPFSLFMGGLIGVIAGISSLQSRRKGNGSK